MSETINPQHFDAKNNPLKELHFSRERYKVRVSFHNCWIYMYRNKTQYFILIFFLKL